MKLTIYAVTSSPYLPLYAAWGVSRVNSIAEAMSLLEPFSPMGEWYEQHGRLTMELCDGKRVYATLEG